MKHARPWEELYPESLRGYVLDFAALPDTADELATTAAIAFGPKPAFVIALPNGDALTLTYQQVDDLSTKFASFLVNRLGLIAGDVVAIQLPNSLHYPIIVLGAWKAGMIVTNVNPLYTEREIRHQIVDSGAKVVVACDLFLPTVKAVVSELGRTLVVASLEDSFKLNHSRMQRSIDEVASLAPIAPSVGFRFMDTLEISDIYPSIAHPRHPIALYQYTGGTTGKSKGAVITHQNLLASLFMTRDFLKAFGGTPHSDETVLTILPLYHVFAFVINFLLFFEAGARNVLVPNPRPLANLRHVFEQYHVDYTSGVDTLYAGLLAEDWFQKNPPKLKFAVSGGAGLRPSTADAWHKMVCPILQGYGMTETSSIISINPPVEFPRPGTSGIPVPGCDVRIIAEDGRELGPMEVGELVVRGPNVIQCYLNQPEETTTAIVDGWLHTGDIAQLDIDGYVCIVDRKKDMILVSGFNVYPNEVEAVIASHPDVAEVAVIGVPDNTTGEAVKAFVSPRRKDLSAEELIAYCKSQLAGYKVPKQVVFQDQLPKTPVGKILRTQLRNG